MNVTLIARVGLAAALGAVALLATAAPATAAPATAAPAVAAPAVAAPAEESLDEVKAALTARIDMRLAALNKDQVTVNNSDVLTDAHRRQLSAVISEATSGLTALKAKVAGETTLADLRADAASMVNDFRVYALVGPQVRLAIAGDHAEKAVDRAQVAHDRLAAAVAEKKAGGADTTAAETDLAEMQAAIDAATRHLNGVVDTLLAVEPSPNTAAMRAAVATARSGIVSTRADLRTAAAEGRAVLAFLRNA